MLSFFVAAAKNCQCPRLRRRRRGQIEQGGKADVSRPPEEQLSLLRLRRHRRTVDVKIRSGQAEGKEETGN